MGKRRITSEKKMGLKMKGFAPTAESHGFSPDLLWSGLRSGCRATKSRRSRSESAKLSGVMSLPARKYGGLARGAPPASRIVIGLHR